MRGWAHGVACGRGFGPVLALWSLCCLLSLSSSDWASRTPGRPSEAEICTAYIAGVMMVTISARCEVADRERWTQAVRLVRLECAPAVWSMAWANCRFRPRGRIGAILTTLQGGIDHSRSASRWSKLPEPFMPAEALGRTLRPAIGNARLWPDRARSQEISVASSDGTADGRYRNITYNVTRGVWNAVDGSQPMKSRRMVAECAPHLDHLVPGPVPGPHEGPNRLIFFIFSCFLAA